ncbi:PP_RS20740 family protein [Pseudomonas sp. DWP3-1-2]|uniref:PP_RS20740 family protein n=1 Tax=Pseudomonas sp. DWP3-1-2 TaxID=2804645 RepID=UPI003CFA5203
MSSFFGDDDGIFDIEEVAGGISSTTPSVMVFKPWHKPRKQYVRDKQWWFHLDFLIQRFGQYRDITTIKYFGLPGSDLLDVNFFSKKMLATEKFEAKRLLVHGFIDTEAEKERADIRLSELLDRPNVDRESKVEHYNFHALAKKGSLALKRVKQNGAYHLINLDFCDGVFKQETFDSMMALFTMQFNQMLDTPWLFFLTTRADKEGITQELLANLDRVFREQVSDDETFVAALEEYRREIYDLARGKKGFSDEPITKLELSEILQACFLYWVVRLTHANEARMNAVSVMKYNVHGGNDFPDMFSYVLRFTKQASVKADALGLAKSPTEVTVALSDEDKCSDKASAVKKLCTSLDVDELLVANANLYEEYAQDMKALLKESGWDVTTYDDEMRA